MKPALKIRSCLLRIVDCVSDARRYKSLRETIAALLLLEDLVSWKVVEEMHFIVRQKPAVINTLTAILSYRNGDLFQHPFVVEILDKFCAEASRSYLQTSALSFIIRSWCPRTKGSRQSPQIHRIPIATNLIAQSLHLPLQIIYAQSLTLTHQSLLAVLPA